MTIRLIPAAKAEMVRIWTYYEAQRRGLGNEFLDDLGQTLRLVQEYPLSQPEFWKGTRRALLKRFPYGFAYRVEKDEILVVVITHTSRATRVWRRRL